MASELWSRGMTTKAIAAQLGVTSDWVSSVSCKNRDMFPRRYHRWTSEGQRDAIVRLRAAGMPCKQIASLLGIDRQTVYRYTTKRGRK